MPNAEVIGNLNSMIHQLWGVGEEKIVPQIENWAT